MRLFVVLLPLIFQCGSCIQIGKSPNFHRYDLKPECEIPEVYIVYTDDVVMLSWTPVDASCSSTITYKARYTVNDGDPSEIDSIAPGVPMAMLPLQKLTCERIAAKVLVKEGDSTIGESVEKTLERDLDDITNLNAEQTSEGLVLTWTPLNLGETCNVIYSIEYKVDSAIERVETEDPEYILPITKDTPCTFYEIKIVATSNNLKSKIQEITFEIGIPEVKAVSFKNEEGRVIVDVKPPENIPEECGEVEYRIIQDDQGCFKINFVVVPLSSNGKEGVSVEKTFTRQPGVVQNPQAVQKGDKIYLDWSPPIGADSCNMVYFIEHGGGTSSSHSTSFVVPLQLQACKTDVIKMIPAIITDESFVEGRSHELELVGEIGTVENVQCSLNTNSVECNWQEYFDRDNCEKFKYELEYFDGIEMNSLEIEETTFEFNIDTKILTCWFKVQPVGYLGDQRWNGKFIEGEIEGCH